tara:strand:+ start:3808 stop:4050 length:243 start_codon:yes stop_codon:yes gene_type:complete
MPINDSELSGNVEPELSELKDEVWLEVLELFEGDEGLAREWMGRTRLFLGNVSPESLLETPEDIGRLRRFIQQIQRGIIP